MHTDLGNVGLECFEDNLAVFGGAVDEAQHPNARSLLGVQPKSMSVLLTLLHLSVHGNEHLNYFLADGLNDLGPPRCRGQL